MEVLYLINTLSSGKAELHILTFYRHLKRAGAEAVAYLKEGRGSRSLRPDFEGEGIRMVPLGSKRVFNGRHLLYAARLVKSERPDLFHTHLPQADVAGFFSGWLIPSVL
ncbi:MAG TPA: hypothetical protein DCL13_04990 [Peptococcaceae bacterium]|nr:hypothetical protein [Peptococcaceae bacterium]